MKILHVTQGYFPALGGTEWMIQRVSEELVRQFGDDVTVFTTNCYSGDAFANPALPRLPVGEEKIRGVNVRRFPVYSRVSQLLQRPAMLAYLLGMPLNQYLRAIVSGPVIPGLTREIRTFPADVIAASSFPLQHMYASLKAAHQSGRPCILHGGLHPQDDWGFQRPMIYQAIRQADHYLANTWFEADYVIRRGAPPDRVHTIGLGVDLELFQNISTEQAKSRLGLQDKTVIGFIGQMGKHKGVDILLRAMPQVWKVVPDAHVLVAGARTPFSDELEQMIRQFPEEARKKVMMIYNFKEEEKPWLFSAIDVFAYPSAFESFGIAYLEAWAAGKPVIGSWRGAVPAVVEPGKDGLLIVNQNVDFLAESLILMLENKSWAQALGANGRRKVQARYTWPEVARRFRGIYEQAIHAK